MKNNIAETLLTAADTFADFMEKGKKQGKLLQ